jgi:hypothetical protein
MRGPNSLPLFLLAVQNTVVNGRTIKYAGVTTTLTGIIPDGSCQLITEEKSLEYSPGATQIMIIPGPLVPEDQGGEGEYQTIHRGTLKFRLICQNAVDSETSDVAALTSASDPFGIYTLYQQLLPLIRFWDETDDSGNGYLIEPMRLQGGLSQPRRNETHKQFLLADLLCEFRMSIGNGASGA